MTEPKACRPEAFQLFCRSLPQLSTTTGLVDAATAIALHALDDVDPVQVHNKLARLSSIVGSRVRNHSTSAVLAHLHEVLFQEEGFVGNTDYYYVALNSYLPAVLDTRTGLPILLSLIYKAVGEPLGLQIEGVNAPGHFMVRIATDEGPAIVDPFYGGVLLSQEEAFRRLEHIAGRRLPRDPQFLAAAPHQQWLGRILTNLINVFSGERRTDDLNAMLELRAALDAAEPA